MARRRFFVESVDGPRAALAGDDARHLRQVLRAEIGQRYELSDNRRVYLAEIEGFRPGQVLFHILEELEPRPQPLPVTLYLALIKFDRFEWALEKATELGAERIVPLIAARGEKGLERAAGKRLERWRRILRESSQQARRARLPEIQPPLEFERALEAPGGCRLFLDEQPCAPLLLTARHDQGTVLLMAGPEGGWTESERARARQAGWTPVSLGPNILRAETAALAALAVLGAVRGSPVL